MDRILSHLLFSRSNKMILNIGKNLHLKAIVDSSFGPYEDGKSVPGVAIMLGYGRWGPRTVVLDDED